MEETASQKAFRLFANFLWRRGSLWGSGLVCAVAYGTWALLEARGASFAGLVALGAAAFAIAAMAFLRDVWPKPKLSPREERQQQLRKKMLAVTGLGEHASDFLGYARRADPSEEKFRKMHRQATRHIELALVRDELEDPMSLFEAVGDPDHGGTVKHRLHEGSFWLDVILARVDENRFHVKDEWDGR